MATPILRVLYYLPYARGGLAEYGKAQAGALSSLPGLELELLAPRNLTTPSGVCRAVAPALDPDTPLPAANKLQRGVRFLKMTLRSATHLDHAIAVQRVDTVLISAYSEYFAPLWAWRFRKWRRKGVRFATVVHDPVRDCVRGPRWWHEWSVAEAYSYIDVAFVHGNAGPDCGDRQFNCRTVAIPHGVQRLQGQGIDRSKARAILGLPGDRSRTFLSFGHIRDGKNLDLFIRAMALCPDVRLVVAGSEQSGGQKPRAHYQRLAQSLGVSDRIGWHTRYIPPDEAPNFFSAADCLLLTYSSDFRSASGVLSAAAEYEVPCLASSGEGPLRHAVEEYGIGVFIKPDCVDAMVAGLGKLAEADVRPNWSRFRSDHTWEKNAEVVASSLRSLHQDRLG
jgi:glycosyltransferase involved in cell wall biosynthesis